jgi:hypothetical protein
MATSFLPSPAADTPWPAPVTMLPSPPEHARYVGAVTCQSSLCHGGASPLHCQYTIWSHDDAHARAYAALVSDYGQNIARAAGIASPTTDASCVACHAPMAMPGVSLASTANVTEGVTCESCHNGAAAWLRSHTRPDYTYADRVQSGLRDLRDTYVRADTCVKCHEVIAPNLIKAGHPALTFELDGQAASEPRHWTEKDSWFGAKAWLVGQLVALTQVSEDIRNYNPDPRVADDEKALLWLLKQVPGIASNNLTADRLAAVAAWSNQLAQQTSDANWSIDRTRQTLTALAGTSDSFRDSSVAQAEQSARAQRLVLALDRLFKATRPLPPSSPMKPTPQPPLPGDAELTTLFDQVQDPAKFDAKKFADSLQKFATVIAPAKN